MATTQKKPASQGKRKTASTSSSRKKAPAKRPIRREVGGVACLLLALCIAIGYFQTEGWLIALLPACCKGLVGWGYYLMAPALAVAAYILLFHKGRPVVLRTVCILLSPVMLGSICHLLLCEVSFASSVGIIPRMWRGSVGDPGPRVSGCLWKHRLPGDFYSHFGSPFGSGVPTGNCCAVALLAAAGETGI